MPDKKLTDSEIKKALECCIKAKTMADCERMSCPAFKEEGCYYGLRSKNSYQDEMIKDAFDLINRLQKEKAEQESEIKILKDSNKNLQELYYTEKEKVKKAKQKVIYIAKTLKTAKSEAIKEFANWQEIKLANNPNISTVALQSIIATNDNLLKELVGENNGNTK